MRKQYIAASLFWLPASIAFAQAPPPAQPSFDSVKSLVTVIYAPRYKGTVRPEPATTFFPREGVTGMVAGEHLRTGAFVSTGEDGKTQVQCTPFQQAVRKVESLKLAARPHGKENVNAK